MPEMMARSHLDRSGRKDTVITVSQRTARDAAPQWRCVPLGPFDLAGQSRYFGGGVASPSDPEEIVMTFPVEGWQGSVAVRLRQDGTGTVVGSVDGAGGGDPGRGWRPGRRGLV